MDISEEPSGSVVSFFPMQNAVQNLPQGLGIFTVIGDNTRVVICLGFVNKCIAVPRELPHPGFVQPAQRGIVLVFTPQSLKLAS